MQIVRCNVCGKWIGFERELDIKMLSFGEIETCPKCGRSGGLMDVEAGCNFSELEIRQLWSMFSDVSMNPETECMEEDFLGFPAGTHREEIWHWFDQRYPGGVHSLLYDGGEQER